MEWLKENWFRLGIVVALIIVATAFYQAAVTLPRERAVRAAAEQAQKEAEEKEKISAAEAANSSMLSS